MSAVEREHDTTRIDPTARVAAAHRFMAEAGAEAARRGATVHRFRVAGVRFEVSVAAALLDPAVDRAYGWAHDASDVDDDLVRVAVLVGPPLVAVPWRRRDLVPRPPETGVLVDGFRVVFEPDRRSLVVVDPERRRAVVWWADEADVPWWEHGAPLRTVVSWALEARGRTVVHGACVGTDAEHGVLVVGRGGVGKSTTALACMAAGMVSTGDDYTALRAVSSAGDHGTHHRSEGLFGAAKVTPGSVGDGLLPSDGAPVHGGKMHVRIPPPAASIRVRGIVVPRLTAGDVAVRPLDGRVAVHAAVTSTVLQSAIVDRRLMTVVTGLARSVPVWEVAINADLDAVVRTIAGLADAATAPVRGVAPARDEVGP